MPSLGAGLAPDPERVLADLTTLAELSGDGAGAQRLTWTEPWRRARTWLRAQLEQLPVAIEVDSADNLWATLAGDSRRQLVIGSHLDSVPGGGWLDGCLGVLAGLEVLRAIAAAGTPPVTVRLVDWAEEEGDQSGHSLLGSTAAAGHLDTELLRRSTSWEGMSVPDLLGANGIEIERMPEAHRQLADVGAYLELHIEQSTRLERANLPLGVVTGTAGVERHRISFAGRRDHPARPMDERADALMAASRFVVALREVCVREGGSSLAGQLEVSPNVPLVVADHAAVIFDVRSFDPEALAGIMDGWRLLARQVAEEERVGLETELRWRIEPAPFHPDLISFAEKSIAELGAETIRLGSPQLHDAGEMARAGIPTEMLFVQSIGGISHSAAENSDRDHLRLGVQALARLTEKTIGWLAEGEENADGA